MKITIEIRELQTLQIDDLSRRTGCNVCDLFDALVNKLKQDANNRSYLLEATNRVVHEHFVEQDEIKRLTEILKQSKQIKNGNKRN